MKKAKTRFYESMDRMDVTCSRVLASSMRRYGQNIVAK